MRRREFVTLLGGVAAAWPLAAGAQQPGKSPRIGFLGATTPTIWSPFVGPFLQRLRELGWIDGRDIAIEYRWAEGRRSSSPPLRATACGVRPFRSAWRRCLTFRSSIARQSTQRSNLLP